MTTFDLPDLQTGTCRLSPLHLAIGVDTTEDFFRATTQGKASTLRTPNTGYNWYRLDGLYLIDAETFAIELCFEQGRLFLLSLSLSDGAQNLSWSTWSESAELDKNRRSQALLVRRYGDPPYHFPWGEVSAAYDPRGGSSSISIRYNKISLGANSGFQSS
jgi:hypothetical protein